MGRLVRGCGAGALPAEFRRGADERRDADLNGAIRAARIARPIAAFWFVGPVMPANLTQPCDPVQPPPVATNSDVGRAYLAAIAWGTDCRRRHIELSSSLPRP